MEWEKMVERLTALLNTGKHSELRGALMMLNEVDIAHFMESLDREKLLLCFRVLPKDVSADVFTYMSADQKQTLIESIGDNEIRSSLAHISPAAVQTLETPLMFCVTRTLDVSVKSLVQSVSQMLMAFSVPVVM